MLLDAKEYFKKQPSLVDISVPDEEKFTVCGDIHGQYYDLYNIFQLNGLPSPENPYVSFSWIEAVDFICLEILLISYFWLNFP